MKWMLLSLVALFLLVMIVLGGGFAWLVNFRTDVSDPAVADKFQKSLENMCVRMAQNEIRGGGTALDYQQEALVKQVCACDMKAVTKILAKKGAKTPIELQQAYNDSQPEMSAAFNSCAAAYGIQ